MSVACSEMNRGITKLLSGSAICDHTFDFKPKLHVRKCNTPFWTRNWSPNAANLVVVNNIPHRLTEFNFLFF